MCMGDRVVVLTAEVLTLRAGLSNMLAGPVRPVCNDSLVVETPGT